MIVQSNRSASQRPSADLPAAVGPAITRMSASAKTSLELVPGEAHDCRATMHVVRGKSGCAQRDVERAHLRRREQVAGFDRRFTGDGGRKLLVLRRGGRLAVSGEGGEGLAQTALRVEARMRHRYAVHEQRVAAESLDLEAQSLEQRAIRLERFRLVRREM